MAYIYKNSVLRIETQGPKILLIQGVLQFFTKISAVNSIDIFVYASCVDDFLGVLLSEIRNKFQEDELTVSSPQV